MSTTHEVTKQVFAPAALAERIEWLSGVLQTRKYTKKKAMIQTHCCARARIEKFEMDEVTSNDRTMNQLYDGGLLSFFPIDVRMSRRSRLDNHEGVAKVKLGDEVKPR